MNTKIKILIAQQDPIELVLLQNALKTGNITCYCQFVQNKMDFENAIKEFVPEIILSDYTLASLDGPTAFELREKLAPDTPFIFLSVIDEKNIIEIIENGLTDYTLKDKIFTLPSKIKRALKVSKDRQDKIKLDKELELCLKVLAQTQSIAKIGSWETDLLTSDVIWSMETFRIYGLNPDDFNGSHPVFLDYVLPEDRENLETAFHESLSNFSDNEIVHRILTPRGIVKILEKCWRIFRNDEGLPIRALGTCQDITDRKNAEEKIKESELRYHSIIEQATDAIFMVGATLNFLEINSSACQLFGYSKEEILQLKFIDLFFKEDLDSHPLQIGNLEIGKTIRKERRLKKKDGTAIDMELSGRATEEGIIIFGNDVTESKRAQNLIRESEAKFRAFFENSLDGIVLAVSDGEILAVNPAVCKMFRMTEEEICAAGRFGMVDISDPRTITLIKERQLTGKAKGEITYLRKDGSKFPGELSSVEFIDSKGEKKTSMIIRDITERKQSEEKLANTSQELQHALNDLNKIMDSSLDVICAVDANGIFIKVSAASEAVWGYKPEELIGKPLINFVYHEDYDKTQFTAGKVMAGKNVTHFENRYIRKDGALVWIEWTARWDEKDKIRYGVARNVTEKKTLEKAFETERRRLHDLLWQAPTLMGALRGPNHIIEIANPLYQELIGKNDIIGKPLMEVVPELIEQGYIKKLDGVYETGKTFSANETLVKLNPTGKGKLVDRYVNLIYQAYRNIDNEIEGIFFFIIDVSEQVISRKKIEESEKRYRQIVETAQEGIWLIDENNLTTFVNDKMCKIFEYGREEMIGQGINHFMDDEGIKIAPHVMIKQKKGEAGQQYFKYLSKSGTEVWTSISSNPLFDDKGIYSGALLMVTDITERKKYETAIKNAYLEKITILESIDDGFFAVDKNSKVLYWNKKAEILLNVKKEDIIGNDLHAVFTNPDSISFYNQYQKAIRENATLHFEEFSIRTNRWFAVSAFPSDNGLSVYFKDVTERKTAEEAVRLSNERYDMVSKATNDSIWDWDFFTDKMIRTGDGFETLFGYKSTQLEVNHLAWEKFVHPDDLLRVQDTLSALFENPLEFYWEDEYRFLKANGQYAYVYDKGYITRDENGKVSRMIGATQDITQQIEHVNEITRIKYNLDSLINTTSDLIWSIGSDMKIVAANKAYSDSIKFVTGETVMEGDEVILKELGQEVMSRWGGYYERALSGESFSVEESTWYPEKQETIHSIISFCPIINIPGVVSGVACYAKDVTDLKKSAKKLQELNRELNVRAEELATSNTELERFAYIASHDLQEPLRMVSSFLQLLDKKYNHQLDETAHKYIHFAVDGANRMKKLIQDLLEYSKAGSVVDMVGNTDMNEVMQEVLMNLNALIEDSGAEIKKENLPVLSNTRKIQMLQLMQNLVSNALKYRGNEKPVISIAAQEEELQWVFSVKDKGIGIEPGFADKIFNLFQRLHNKSDYSGTGIGLSICKKIVERHGGKIWVEPNEGKGSAFYFSISKEL